MTEIRATAVPRLTLVTALLASAIAGVLVGLAITATTPIPGLPEPGAVVRIGLPIVRVLLDMAAVGTVGLSILPILIGFGRPKLAEQVLAGTRRVAAAVALTWAFTALAALVLQTAELRPNGDVSLNALLAYIADIGAGKALAFVAVFALVSAGLAAWSVRAGESVPAELRTAVALFGLLPLPVTGHASDWQWHDLTMISMELHVMSAAAWTGGLCAVVVLLAANRTLLALALPRFSKLATVCLIVAGATGLFNGFAELLLNPGSESLWDKLFGTGYGIIVFAKILCFAALGVLAAHIRLRLLPAIVRHERTPLVGWAGMELGVMGLAFGLAVILSRAPVS